MKFSVALIEFLIVLSTTVTASRTFNRDKGRIFSGYNANAGQFPYMVAVELIIQGNIALCGGSLIGPTWVLTAAHCFEDVDFLLILLGSTVLDKAEAGYILPPDNVILHPEYDRKELLHDIALISVPKVVPCTLVSTIALPSAQTAHQSYVGKHGLISGWGATVTEGTNTDRMQWGHMLVVDNEVCSQLDPTINIALLCAKPVNNAAPSGGDSGGPLVSGSTLIGVVSYQLGNEQREDDAPVVFTRVSFYLEWIKDVTGIST